jgi:hypothetical protein
VAHLDPHCFHITEGRYFGLQSNFTADPNFVGPNAPGISGVNASGGSGLATSSSGGGISGAMALTLSTTYNGTTAGTAAALRSAMVIPPILAAANKGSLSSAARTVVVTKEVKVDSPSIKPSPTVAEPAKTIGPRPTAPFADLKKIFDEGGPFCQSMKECMIKAAVHANRSGRHGVSWLAPNGETYPDVSKAFAIYAGIKPCLRCKSNKQGAYHCRLRRKHKDLDHDGGNSPAMLSALFVAPMDSLIYGGDKVDYSTSN